MEDKESKKTEEELHPQIQSQRSPAQELGLGLALGTVDEQDKNYADAADCHQIITSSPLETFTYTPDDDNDDDESFTGPKMFNSNSVGSKEDQQQEPNDKGGDEDTESKSINKSSGAEAEGATASGEEDNAPESEDDGAYMNALIQLLQQRLGINFGSVPPQQETPPKLLEDLSLEGIAKYIQSNKCTNIIVMTGAGISTAAGIPDFRSPGTGLYDNLQKYNLPSPQCIFEIGYFRENPEPFFMLAKELYPGNYKPTVSHYFIKMLADKEFLLRTYTQNIDGLERVTGLSDDLIIEAHGTFHTSHCIDCTKEYTEKWVKGKIFSDEVPTCEECNGIVKPDIVFFGEGLPKRFFGLMPRDLNECDLLIVMGTSLKVQPFASLIDRVPKTTPRLLINREKCGVGMMPMYGGFDFDSDQKYRDVVYLGSCDDGCEKLADLLGWKDDLFEFIKEDNKRLDVHLSAMETSQKLEKKNTKLTDPSQGDNANSSTSYSST